MKLISPFSVMLLAVKKTRRVFNLDKLSLLHLVAPSATNFDFNSFQLQSL